jgi:hypothetical protein
MAPQQIIYRLPQCQQMAVRQPIPVEGYLVQAGRTYAGYFEYGFRVRSNFYLIKWALLGTKKSIQHRSWILSHQMVPAIADAAGNLSEM